METRKQIIYQQKVREESGWNKPKLCLYEIHPVVWNLFEFLFCEKTKDTFLLIWFIFKLNGPTQLYFAFTGKSYDNHMQIEIEFRIS